MSLTLFGTCRINGISNNNNLNNLINYTHSTKEVLQQIKFLTGAISIPPPFNRLCFRTGIVEGRGISYSPEFNKLFAESKVCIVEICSEKKYVYGEFYLHHLCVDNRFADHNRTTPKLILENFKCLKQTTDEIESDVLEIKKLLECRKMVIVTHYNSKINGKYIPARSSLIELLTEICIKHNIHIINPSEVLKQYSQEEIMTFDLGHYTPLGLCKISEYIDTFIDDMIKQSI
jgi:hypothetical protein